MISIFLAEDDPKTREHLKALIGKENEFELSGWADRVAELPDALKHLTPDVLLLDLTLKDGDAVESIGAFVEAFPRTRILVLSVLDDEDHVIRAIRAGAKGYLLKGKLDRAADENADTLLSHEIRTVHLGGSPLGPGLAQKLVTLLVPPEEPRPCPLTTRQVDVLRMIAAGFRYKDISAELGISPHTVRTHIRNIYDTLEVGSKREAIAKGRRFGIFRSRR